ncbi:hypothetical protein RN001_015216 [Aquatica leii]|uniref:NFX1-type zinc finger-containing protein 1 n=1 Tax=Aquatica leii TaxID=1421715 RepID=A0AAN7PQH7_9COLE|nr:hypothetical protein RN001_015216 [Aquatica leii]
MPIDSGTVSRRSFRIGFRKLEEWSDEDSYLLVIDVLDHLDDFCSVLNSSHLNPDWIVIIAKIFGKISSTVFPECRNVIVERVSTTNIFTEIDNFVQRRQSILTHSAYYADSEYLFSDLALLAHCVREANPNANFDHIVFFKRSQLSSANNSGRNSFRQMNVYPTPEEILHNKRETVYQNVINSKYSDVNHYLNVQFRLLREDFVAPLRQGVSAYLFGSKDTPNVIVHKNVNFICPIAGKDEIGVLVQFTKKKNKKKDAYRKRFMNGSLLCFTADNFRSLIFGRVVNGDEALLQKGQIAVGFENVFEIQLFDLTFTMVECLVFFEPYYRVLKALQCMKETCFPMKEYLVDVNPQAYNAAYIKTSTCYNIDGCNVSLTKPNTWPSSNHLRLNDSQRSAFIAALTHKFVVIQGPPGTGKTYLGLKIAEALVKNEHAWYDGSPILVVCLTNHALDQFLEGIVRVTDRVVRIGGQSKSEVLKQYSIREKHMEDIQTMKEMLVVGMTTTGAARLQKTLMALRSPIVIVEEAAEILEAHITVSLTKNCQHLILIGDHKQLRPSCADYNIEKKYNLGISLFERMLKNNIKCHTLSVQHRMRPTIAELIVPAIYPRLQNASSVYDFPPIKGVASSVFFLDHNYPENTVNKTSKSNLHEAKFFIAFAAYLIECGYKPEEITILAAYFGQMLALGTERRKRSNLLKNVRITVLDNYQGEENKIILLSLTRNNKNGSIGFLKTENRVCVALSRAKEGLYIMGNMNLLCMKSEIWPKIKIPLMRNNSLGTGLTLRCENRHEHTTIVRTAEDFKDIRGGICKKICNARLNCGHTCTIVCHTVDRDHRNVQCKVTVSERCVNNHLSTRLCFQKPKPCLVVMLKLFPCAHEHLLPCSVNDYKCDVTVEVDLPCGHSAMKPCYYPIAEFPCKNPCTRVNRDCSLGTHICKLKCYESCLLCPVSVKKITIDCHHELVTKCSTVPTRWLCSKNCVQRLSCGHMCTMKCNESCTLKCEIMVDNPHEVVCGHKFKIECHLSKTEFENHDQDLLRYCDAPCEAILACSHKCSGTCGACIQGRVHVPCTSQCDRILMCGHKCMNSCNEAHGPCNESCSYRCKHNKCTKKCTEACFKCPEICERRCAHVQCSLQCGEICNVPPCSQLCSLMLPCGHPCLGFCGDPCPNLCGVCDFTDMQNIHFVFDWKVSKVFVMLDECKHIVENDRMELWLNMCPNEIIYKSCPKCRVPLTSTQRYSHLIKKAKSDINDVSTNNSLHQTLYKQLDIDYLNDASDKLRYSFIQKTTCFNILLNHQLLEKKSIDSGTVGRRSFRIGFRKLEEWSNEDSYLLMIDVLDHLDDFCSVLNLSHLNPDWVVIIAKIFGKISSTVFPECRNVIVERVSTTNIFTEIDNFVQRLQSRLTHSAYYADSEDLFSDLALLAHCVREANPNANFDHIVFFKRSQLSSANNSGRNSFRQMNVYPTPEEILHKKRETVYQNVINSKYSDVDHYLNVQFRLLREDFVAPLRDGVSKYLSDSKDTPNVIVHKNVNFICPIAGKDEIGVLIAVGFENGFEIQLFDLTFTMVECLVFFEPYYRVLKALQCMKETCFPMKEYLVDVNPQAYNAAYIKTSTCYNIDGCNVSLTKPNTWPSSNHLRLNDSQRSAFIAALTHKFVVIQGPPGTGKTYLGLKIAETLVKNEHAWYDGSPILVVCLTNHALDQFLEGIVRVTDRVVRIGGQSKSEVLKQYSIREKRNNLAFKPHINRAWYNVKKNLRVYLDEIQELSDKLQSLSSYEDIICFSEFRTQYGKSWCERATITVDKIENNDELTDDEDSSDDSDDDDMLDEENPKEWQLDLGNDAIYNQRNFTKYLWSLRDLQLDIEKLEKQRNTNRNNKKLQELIEEQRFLKACLGNGRTMFKKVKPRNCNLNNPFTMSLEERWTLYFYWLEECRLVLVQKLVDVQSTYRAKFNQWLEIRDIEDIQTMKEMLVVGMTTTGAARLQKTLMALRSPIVIVEEAAEVLEAHITVSLTKNCQHLILLGDHQQLRPSVADYNIEKKYNLGISLFERMVKNNITCHTLSVQHRMRPTIADLIVPAIYPRLQNASSVYDFPPIKGVASSVFFLDHNYPENTVNKTSKSNLHEAKFFIAFAAYLIECGYKPEEITILAAYSAQMLALRRQRRKRSNLLKNLRITVVDNYQGEENKIILLSLTRNNGKGLIGFLKTENRVCVALSRAREGFYIMGNINLLCMKSEIWPKIKIPLIRNNSLGTDLTLRCENRHEHTTIVRTAEDFQKIRGDICKKICNAQLNCGHTCTIVCHTVDRDHRNVQCKVTVSECCVNNHLSTRTCFQERKPCLVAMSKLLPCAHEHVLPCSVNEYKCDITVEVFLPCGHSAMKPCYYPIAKFPCKKPCTRVNRECSLGTHICKLMCYENCRPCLISAKKITIDCHHELVTKCSTVPTRKLCSKTCVQRLSCGHMCTMKCNESCTLKCEIMVDNPHEVVCGHKFKIECHLSKTGFENHDQDLLRYCDAPCEAILACSHKCSGTCGICIQGRVHVPCTSQCDRILMCGHKCMNSCYEAHGPCNESCSYRCKHNKCTKKCNEACFKCPEICERRCAHVQCSLQCGDICNVPPCSKLCSLILPCGHPCLGFCGDPCPNLCGICDFTNMQKICLEFDLKVSKGFVMLDECKHIVEKNRMELWLNRYPNEIIYKSCPKCRVPLTSTQRYSHLIKKAKSDINDVSNNNSLHHTLYKQLDTDYLNDVSNKLRCFFIQKTTFFDTLFRQLLLEKKSIDRRLKFISFQHFQYDLIKFKLMQDLIHTFDAVSLHKQYTLTLATKNLYVLLKKLIVEYFSDEIVSNLYQESCRFFRLIQTLQIRDSNRFDSYLENVRAKQIYDDINQLLYVTTPYSTRRDEELKAKIQTLSKMVRVQVLDQNEKFLQSEIKIHRIRFLKCARDHVNVVFVNDNELKKQTCRICRLSLTSPSTCNIL